MKLYKATDSRGVTGRGYPCVDWLRCVGWLRWRPGTVHRVGERLRRLRPVLCSNRVIHAYVHPLQAALFDDDHTGYLGDGGQLWLARGAVVIAANDKVGVHKLATVRRVRKIRRSMLFCNAILAAFPGCSGGFEQIVHRLRFLGPRLSRLGWARLWRRVQRRMRQMRR